MGFRPFCEYSVLAGGEPFIISLPFMKMPGVTAFQKDQEKRNLLESIFYRYEGSIYLFVCVLCSVSY